MDAGWIFHGEVTIDKCPQAQAIRTKSQALMFTTLNKDSSKTRPALADYLMLFRKRGDNDTPIKNDVDNETWIEWARPIWTGIRETRTLNARSGRDHDDERHICPLQLDLIERVVRLWSNRGETVLSPFAGIGSEGVESIRHGRRFVGCELKPSYWQTAVENLRQIEADIDRPTLMDGAV
jgi:DNA modification methylase